MSASQWLRNRAQDGGFWLSTLVTYLPARVTRLAATSLAGLRASLTLVPDAAFAARCDNTRVGPFLRLCGRGGALRVTQLLLESLDLVGLPELFALAWRILTHTSPLTPAEIEAAASVLGPNAVRYRDIRVAEGGLLRWVLAYNGNRAFTTFHTINLPLKGPHQRSNLDILVHEIVHVCQYERAGSPYFAEALLAQHEEGYGYGGPDGLIAAASHRKGYRDFNREQQAQIVQDYLARTRAGADVTAYKPFMEQLRQGRI